MTVDCQSVTLSIKLKLYLEEEMQVIQIDQCVLSKRISDKMVKYIYSNSV